MKITCIVTTSQGMIMEILSKIFWNCAKYKQYWKRCILDWSFLHKWCSTEKLQNLFVKVNYFLENIFLWNVTFSHHSEMCVVSYLRNHNFKCKSIGANWLILSLNYGFFLEMIWKFKKNTSRGKNINLDTWNFSNWFQKKKFIIFSFS